tara:strand:+ start:361 stop:462 length:102 start_codon:yes stop_codon:yes gene_type:complete
MKERGDNGNMDEKTEEKIGRGKRAMAGKRRLGE